MSLFLFNEICVLFQSDEDNNTDWSSFHVVGTCQDLEKQYFRMSGVSEHSLLNFLRIVMSELS